MPSFLSRLFGRTPEVEPLDQRTIDFGMSGRKPAIVGTLAHEADWLYTIWETDFLYLDTYPHRHIMQVPVSISAVGFDMGILLTFQESLMVEAGDNWTYFEDLARQVQDNPFRFNSTPISASPRFNL